MLTDAPQVYSPRRTRILNTLTVATILSMIATFAMALFYASTDDVQGNVQRIFYMHVGAFTGGTTAFFITVIAGIMYLRTRNAAWDRLAVSSVEVGLPLMTITLVTGMIWARPTWNAWWVSDPRLNTMAVMWLLYAAYLTLRHTVENPDQRARFAAVYGILAFVSVIYTFTVIRTRTDTLHPCTLGPCPTNPNASTVSPLTPSMTLTISISSIAWMLTAGTLVWHRLRLENVVTHIQALKMRLLNE